MYSQAENVPESLGLDADALEEISQLQENILQTLRNEWKKLKEPEVMGASIISTPTYEIGQDMTPLPSVRGSAVYLLKPIRVFSPILSACKRMTRVVKAKVKKKSSVSTSSQHHRHQRSTAKYDYKLRNYPRPWADAPTRRRTISTESLQVHVTSSHFSDMSVTSPVQNFVPAGLRTVIDDEEDDPASAPKTRREDESESRSNQLVKVESSERWRKSTICNGQQVSNNMMVLNEPPPPFAAAIKKLQNLKQMNTTNNNQVEIEVNYMFEDASSKLEEKSTHNTVIFPAPIPESKKFAMSPRRKLYKLNNSYRSKNDALRLLEMFNLDDSNNNNNNADDDDQDDKELKSQCPATMPDSMKNPSSLVVNQNKVGIPCEVNCKTLIITKSIQVSSLNNQASQTAPNDDDGQSLSSDGFELGLFVATLVDDLITTACKNCESRKTQRKQDSDNNNNNKSSSSSRNPNSKPPKVKVDKSDHSQKTKLKSLASLSATKKNRKPVTNNNQNKQKTGATLKNNKLNSNKSTNNTTIINCVVNQKLKKNSSKPTREKINDKVTLNLQPHVSGLTAGLVINHNEEEAVSKNTKNINSSHPNQLRVQEKSPQITTKTTKIDEETTVNSESIEKDLQSLRKKSLRRRKPRKREICENTICGEKSSSLIKSKQEEEEAMKKVSISNLEIKWLNPQLKNDHNILRDESCTSIQNFTPTTTNKTINNQKQEQTNCNRGLSILEPSLKLLGRKKRNIRMSYNPPNFDALWPTQY